MDIKYMFLLPCIDFFILYQKGPTSETLQSLSDL